MVDTRSEDPADLAQKLVSTRSRAHITGLAVPIRKGRQDEIIRA
ncbi:hypothetical protein [Spirosoma spitsbergense]|nr:hypothetical protein [Spirosoma spitsbergense]